MSPSPAPSLGLFTDLYELRMAQTCLREGLLAPATFSLYVRPTPARPWLVAAGIDQAIDVVERLRFGEAELGELHRHGLGKDLQAWLADLVPQGEIRAVAEGTIVLAEEPLLELTAPLPLAMLLETAILNVVHLATLIATKAARCVAAADGRQLADFGLRRAHGLETGVEVARAAYLGGIDGTSNVEAGRRYGIPVVGTMAHSFVQAIEDEVAAFRAFARDHPDSSVLLVDTYDTLDGVRNAIVVADEMRERGETLGGVRLDSGDLLHLASEARAMLDEAGHADARIFASGGLDEASIHDLVEQGAPIDAFGVGTSLVVSRDHPALDIVYKLVEYDGEPRAKYSEGKVLLPGAKQILRTDGPDTDVLARSGEDQPGHGLLDVVWRDGERLVEHDLEASRSRTREGIARLPSEWRQPRWAGPTPLPKVSEALQRLTDKLREEQILAQSRPS